MTRLTSALAATTLVAAGLAACGGGSGSHVPPPAAIPLPPANATAAPKNAGRAGATMVVTFTKTARRGKTARRYAKQARQPRFVSQYGDHLHFVATAADGSATASVDVPVDQAAASSTGQQTVTGIPIFAPAGTLQVTEIDGTATGDDHGAPMATATVAYQNVVPGADTTLTYTGNAASDTLQSPLTLAAIGDVLWFEDTNASLWLAPVPFFGRGGVQNPITLDVATAEDAGFYLDGDSSGNCQPQFTLPLHVELDTSEEDVADLQGFPLFAMPTLTVTGTQTIANPNPTPVPTALPTAVPNGTGTFSVAYSSSIGGYTLSFPFIDTTGASVTQVTGYLSWSGIDPLTLAASSFRVPITIVGPPVGDATHYPSAMSCTYVPAPGPSGTPLL